jgi:hypothetical protein
MLFSFLNRAWSIVSTLGFITIVVIWLSPELQGFYFTFISLLILLQVADVGFGIVLVQFASHEWADLEFDSDGRVVGASRARQRLGSLVRIGIRWYAAAAIVFFVGLGFGGDVFFSVSPDAAVVEWRTPWWLLCMIAALYLLLVPMQCILEGCGQVATSQRNLLIANVLGTLAGWVVLLSGGELYAIFALFLVRTAVGHPLNTIAALPILRLCLDRADDNLIRWKQEFWPQQWRIWVSWMCGFFVFQSFAPIAFQIEGAATAGQIGVMVQAFHAVNQLASARLSADQPRMGGFAARRDFEGLLRLVRRSTHQNILAAVFLVIAAIGCVYVIKAIFPESGTRFGAISGFALFVMAAIPMQLSNVQTAAVRFQKIEPFVGLNIVCAILMLAGSIVMGGEFGAEYIPVVFFAVSVSILIPGVWYIFRRNMGGIYEN